MATFNDHTRDEKFEREYLVHDLASILDHVPDPLYVPTLVVGISAIDSATVNGRSKNIVNATTDKITNDMWAPLSRARGGHISTSPIFLMQEGDVDDFENIFIIDERVIYTNGYSSLIFTISKLDANTNDEGKLRLKGPGKSFTRVNRFLKSDGVSTVEGFPSVCSVQKEVGVTVGGERDRVLQRVSCICFKTTISSSPSIIAKLRDYYTYSLIMDMI